MSRNMRLLPSRLGPVLASASLLAATAGGGSPAALVAAADAPSFAAPAARAAALDLPEPSSAAAPGRPHCAADVTGTYPTACFPLDSQVVDYVAGNPARNDATTITLAGFGGTAAQTPSGAAFLGKTCTGPACTGQTTTWFAPTASNCTHAYPDNDYYRDNVSTFYYALNYAVGVGNLNCNRMILYRGTNQPGAGALDCGSTTSTCGSGSIAYQSLSWHNG